MEDRSIIEKNLHLFRLYDGNHIICEAPYLYRKAYYSSLKILTGDIAGVLIGYSSFFQSFRKLCVISDNYRDYTSLNKKDINLLKKTYIKYHKGLFGFLRHPLYSYKYVYALIIEAGFILYLGDKFGSTFGKKAEGWLADTCRTFKLSEKTYIWLGLYLKFLFSQDTPTLLSYSSESEIRLMSKTVFKLTRHICNNLDYVSLPIYNISIIATVSAGKSTFINALLGNEIFPESQAACTAKITSIYDNDAFKRIAGIAIKADKIKYASNSLLNRDLINWNANEDIERIILEGNLDNISSHNKIIAVHDTPGTNFSGDHTHKEITIDFLQNTHLDIMLCVLNAEYIATTDALNVLKDLESIIKKHPKLKVLFILNKIDSFDREKESTEGALRNVQDFLHKAGFLAPIIIPTSAKAVRLFKMALTGKESAFTENEMDSFRKMMRVFFNDFIMKPVGMKLPAEYTYTYSDDEYVSIDGKEYKLRDIEKALYHTGFTIIEQIIDSQI